VHNFDFGTNQAKIPTFNVLTIIGCWPIMSHKFPKEGKMVLKGLSQILNIDFSLDAADLKKNVSINTRKQIRQKGEGFRAS
tara:strand:+ start:80 stop:322 length:243 start_codon:yes stop_codon:yes gene_type:complete